MLRRRLRRDTIVAFCSKVSACVVAMGACCGARPIGRALAGQGHEIRLMPPEYVRPPMSKRRKTTTAEALIASAYLSGTNTRRAELPKAPSSAA